MLGDDVTVSRSHGHGWGPFTGRQLTLIVCVAIVAAIAIPTAAFAAIGTFTSTTVTPAVTGTNSATVANAKGMQGSATATNTNTRYGVVGSAWGINGIGVQGGGAKYGLYSNGPLGIAAGKTLNCTGCITGGDLAASAKIVPGLGTSTNLASHGTGGTTCTLGQIRLYAGNQFSNGEVAANGQLVAISQNIALYSILGTNYGGDGISSFALPNLAKLAPNHMTYTICIAWVFP